VDNTGSGATSSAHASVHKPAHSSTTFLSIPARTPSSTNRESRRKVAFPNLTLLPADPNQNGQRTSTSVNPSGGNHQSPFPWRAWSKRTRCCPYYFLWPGRPLRVQCVLTEGVADAGSPPRIVSVMLNHDLPFFFHIQKLARKFECSVNSGPGHASYGDPEKAGCYRCKQTGEAL
jgi:hypothetical protein